jgi:hypothetical protein
MLGIISRQDQAGDRGNLAEWGFWTCAAGRRDYYSDRRDGIAYCDALGLVTSFALGYFQGALLVSAGVRLGFAKQLTVKRLYELNPELEHPGHSVRSRDR